jgi:hypothetical protein
MRQPAPGIGSILAQVRKKPQQKNRKKHRHTSVGIRSTIKEVQDPCEDQTQQNRLNDRLKQSGYAHGGSFWLEKPHRAKINKLHIPPGMKPIPRSIFRTASQGVDLTYAERPELAGTSYRYRQS